MSLTHQNDANSAAHRHYSFPLPPNSHLAPPLPAPPPTSPLHLPRRRPTSLVAMGPSRAPKPPKEKAPPKAKSTAGTTLDVKRHNKPHALLPRPEGMSDADWQNDVTQCQASTKERKGRCDKMAAQKATQVAASMAEGLAFPAQIRTPERSAAAASRTSTSSPSNSSYYQEPTVATPRSRLGYPRHDGYGGQGAHDG